MPGRGPAWSGQGFARRPDWARRRSRRTPLSTPRPAERYVHERRGVTRRGRPCSCATPDSPPRIRKSRCVRRRRIPSVPRALPTLCHRRASSAAWHGTRLRSSSKPAGQRPSNLVPYSDLRGADEWEETLEPSDDVMGTIPTDRRHREAAGATPVESQSLLPTHTLRRVWPDLVRYRRITIGRCDCVGLCTGRHGRNVWAAW